MFRMLFRLIKFIAKLLIVSFLIAYIYQRPIMLLPLFVTFLIYRTYRQKQKAKQAKLAAKQARLEVEQQRDIQEQKELLDTSTDVERFVKILSKVFQKTEASKSTACPYCDQRNNADTLHCHKCGGPLETYRRI